MAGAGKRPTRLFFFDAEEARSIERGSRGMFDDARADARTSMTTLSTSFDPASVGKRRPRAQMARRVRPHVGFPGTYMFFPLVCKLKSENSGSAAKSCSTSGSESSARRTPWTACVFKTRGRGSSPGAPPFPRRRHGIDAPSRPENRGPAPTGGFGVTGVFP